MSRISKSPICRWGTRPSLEFGQRKTYSGLPENGGETSSSLRPARETVSMAMPASMVVDPKALGSIHREPYGLPVPNSWCRNVDGGIPDARILRHISATRPVLCFEQQRQSFLTCFHDVAAHLGGILAFIWLHLRRKLRKYLWA